MKRFYKRNEEEIAEYLNIDGKSQELITPEIISICQKIEKEYDDNYRYAFAWFFDDNPPTIAEEDMSFAINNYSYYELREEKRINGIVIFKIIEMDVEDYNEIYDVIYENKREEKLFD
jgi:hypothetical protein